MKLVTSKTISPLLVTSIHLEVEILFKYGKIPKERRTIIVDLSQMIREGRNDSKRCGKYDPYLERQFLINQEGKSRVTLG